jgi:hypothetical protein
VHGLPEEQTPLDEPELELEAEVVAAGAAAEVVVSAGAVYATAADVVVVGATTGATEVELSTGAT